MREHRIQALWSGYGEIVRMGVEGLEVPSVVVKRVQPPSQAQHPRGWSSDRSHQRKLRSYQVEQIWYERFAQRTGELCRLPKLLGSAVSDGDSLFVLEDLNASGFPERRASLAAIEVEACLDWLAAFHGLHLGTSPSLGESGSLWQEGSYWHLATRPDELDALTLNSQFRRSAPLLDARLSGAKYRSLIHGDAKLANFCFAPQSSLSPSRVAAVDFQYVGGGCGMKDVAYFFSSCLDSAECQVQAPAYLDRYFATLRSVLGRLHPQVDASAVEADWRQLYCFAWADFERFLAGWAPDHFKIHDYGLHQSELALAQL